MNETSLCAIKEGMFLSVFDEKLAVLNKKGHDNKILCYGCDKNGGKRTITVSNESKVICISSVNKLTADTQANVIFDQQRMFFGKILHSKGKY